MRTMWVVVMLGIAVLVGAGVYWLSLATLPEDDDLGESGVRPGSLGEAWRRAGARVRGAAGRVVAEIAALRLADRLRAGLQHLGLVGGGVEGPRSSSDGSGGGRASSGPAGSADQPVAEPVRAASPPSMSAAVAAPPAAPPVPAPPATVAEAARLVEAPPVGEPTSGRERAPALGQPPAPASASEVTPTAPAGALGDGGRVSEDVLYLPVARDEPTAHTRIVGVLGILALVTIAGGLLALGVWQTVHLIARAVQQVSGG